MENGKWKIPTEGVAAYGNPSTTQLGLVVRVCSLSPSPLEYPITFTSRLLHGIIRSFLPSLPPRSR